MIIEEKNNELSILKLEGRLDAASAKEIKSKINELVNDNQWRIMSEAAYNTARRYTWEDATDLLEQAFHTAIERNESGDFDN